MLFDPAYRLTRRTALCGLALLVGCGFVPVHTPGGAGEVLQNAVSVTAPDTIAGFALRRRLNDRLGHVVSPRFELATTLASTQSPATVTTEGDTTRFNLSGAATWTLTETASGAETSGTVETFASYSATGSTVATQSAREDAEERLSIALADLIVARLILVVGNQ